MNSKDNSVPVYTEYSDINEEQFDRPGSGIQYSKLFTFLFHVQSAKGKKKGIRQCISIQNYHREMKLVPIIMNYCLLHFDALKFFLRVRLHERSLPNFCFFSISPQIFQ